MSQQGSYTIHLPGLDDIIKIPALEDPDVRRRRILRMRLARTPLAEPLQWIPSAINTLDDAQDLLFTVLTLGRPVIRRLPARLIPFVGIILTANDLLNFTTAALATSLGGRRPKRLLAEALELFTVRKGRLVKRVAKFLEPMGVRQWAGFAIQAAQASVTVTGYGLSLGAIMGAVTDSMWGFYRLVAEGGQLTIRLPPPSSLFAKASRFLQQSLYIPWIARSLDLDDLKLLIYARAAAVNILLPITPSPETVLRMASLAGRAATNWQPWNPASLRALAENPDLGVFQGGPRAFDPLNPNRWVQEVRIIREELAAGRTLEQAQRTANDERERSAAQAALQDPRLQDPRIPFLAGKTPALPAEARFSTWPVGANYPVAIIEDFENYMGALLQEERTGNHVATAYLQSSLDLWNWHVGDPRNVATTFGPTENVAMSMVERNLFLPRGTPPEDLELFVQFANDLAATRGPGAGDATAEITDPLISQVSEFLRFLQPARIARLPPELDPRFKSLLPLVPTLRQLHALLKFRRLTVPRKRPSRAELQLAAIAADLKLEVHELERAFIPTEVPEPPTEIQVVIRDGRILLTAPFPEVKKPEEPPVRLLPPEQFDALLRRALAVVDFNVDIATAFVIPAVMEVLELLLRGTPATDPSIVIVLRRMRDIVKDGTGIDCFLPDTFSSAEEVTDAIERYLDCLTPSP